MRIKSPLANFTDTLDQIKDSAERYAETLRENESATRAVLIDPVLRVLGWDIANPIMVEVEKAIDEGFVDYALYSDNQEIQIIIEAKKLETNLNNKKIFLALVKYAFAAGVKDIFLTDGLIWYHFTDFSPGVQAPTKILSIKDDDLVEIASYLVQRLDAARFWPEAKDVDELAQQLNQLEGEVNGIQLELARLKPLLSLDKTTIPETTLEIEKEHVEIPSEFILLENIEQAKGTKPTKLLLPDGTEVKVATWTAVLIQCSKFTMENNKDIPIPFKDTAGKKVDLISVTRPPSGITYFETEYNGKVVFIYTNYDSNHCIKNALHILKQVPGDLMKTKPAVIFN